MWCNNGKEQGWNDPPALPDAPEPYLRLRLAWTFLLTSPGVPLIYYGDEIGLAGAGDPDNRRFMTFEPDLTDDQHDTLKHVKLLAAARRSHPAFRRGRRHTLLMDGDGLLWAYGMRAGDDRAIVVINRSPDPRSPQVPVDELDLEDGTELVDAIHDQVVTVSGGSIDLNLDARDSAVLVTAGQQTRCALPVPAQDIPGRTR